MQTHFDRFAILLSGLCAIHCVALPIVASLLPLLATTIQHGHQLHEFWFHQFILIFILPVSIIALLTGYKFHKTIMPIFIAGLGLAILVGTSLFIEDLLAAHIIPHSGETILTVVGGIIHAVGHILNIQATKKEPHCSH